MDTRYEQTVRIASEMIVVALLDNEGELLVSDPSGLDERVRQITRALGRLAVEGTYRQLVERLVEQTREPGMAIQKSPEIAIATVFGHVNVRSPYLRNKRRNGACLRPVATRWKLHHRGRTRAVERALVDFGAEESFGQASRRFEEHYGFAVDRTTVLRVVEGHARRAEEYVNERLDAARQRYDEITRTYVGRMDGYPIVVGQLFAAACHRGLSTRTAVTCVADGGHGLREEMDAQFIEARFVLDRPHAKHHLYETADAMGLVREAREAWVARHIEHLDHGDTDLVLEELRAHKGRGKSRVRRLMAHFTRFRDAFGYDAIREQGLPIASGEVESAHRVIPQKRLKLPGAWWHPDMVNPMLALRILRANDWWHDFWALTA